MPYPLHKDGSKSEVLRAKKLLSYYASLRTSKRNMAVQIQASALATVFS